MSTVKISKMRWDNLFSYADGNSIDLSSDRVTQIVGRNGAGKSSIPTIMEEGLYNKNSKGFKKADIPNRHLNKPYTIDITFSIDDNEYCIQIKKASTLKATLYENGEDVSKNTGSGTIKMVEDLIGIDFKTFTQLVYQNTDSSLQFLTATDSKRKEFLVNLFDLAEYGEKYKIFNDALKHIQTQLNKIEGSIEATKKSLVLAEKNSKIEVGELVEVPEEPDSIISTLAEYKSRLSDLESYNSRIVRSNKVLEELARCPVDKEALETALAEYENIEDDKPYTQQLADINSKIRQAKQVIEKVEKVGNSCPTCLQEVSHDFIKGLIKENEETIESNRAEGTEISAKIKTIQELKKKREDLKSQLTKIETLESRKDFDEIKDIEDSEDIKKSIQQAESEIRSVRAKIKKAQEQNNLVSSNQAKLDSANEQLAYLEDELNKQVESLANLEKRVGPLEVLKKAFSPTGLVAYKLENRVKDLETYTNHYLSRLSDGRFNLTFELEKDKLNVVIFDGENPVSIASLSSGEKSRVVIGTLLGIRKIMSSISKTTVNVLFLDEVISVLDDEGKEQLVEVLLQEEGLNTFLVSHSWSHPLVKRLEVEKVDGISMIHGE